MFTLTISTDQTDHDGDNITHEHTLAGDEARAVLTQMNTGVDYLVFTAADGTHAVKLMDVHKVSVE